MKKALVTLCLMTLASCAVRSHGPSLPDNASLVLPSDLMSEKSPFVEIEVVTDGATSSGGGVWLGDGQVLTATHIFLGVKSPADPIFVTVHGQKVKANVVFHGQPPHNDLLLLKIDQTSFPASLTKVVPPKICADVEPVGAQLYIPSRDSVYQTYASPAGTVMYKGKTWSNSTTALLSHGISGSPVYQGKSGCLAGIVSRMDIQASGTGSPQKQQACMKATLQGEDAHLGVTCTVDAKTIFMTADDIQEFLKEARTYLQTRSAG